jgi:hypothetical protein
MWGAVDGELRIDGVLDSTLTVVGLSHGLIDIRSSVPTVARIETLGTGFAGRMLLHALAGTLTVDGVAPSGMLSGSVEIANDLTGEITVGSASYEADLTGSITIHGDVFGGTIKVYGDMKPADPNDPNSPSPYIRIDGAFIPDDDEPSIIDIDGAYEGDKRFITIDFDGYDAADAWEANATITIGPDPNPDEYTENTPEARIFATTYCKGDMLNDGLCDFGDIDALVAAFDPEAFGEAFPEVAGSRLYHGDLDCSSEVDFKDIDAFVARLGTCTPDCYEGDNMQGGGEGEQMQMMGGGAAIIAAQLAASVSAENMPALLAAVEQLALNPPANSTIDWSAVLAALGGM